MSRKRGPEPVGGDVEVVDLSDQDRRLEYWKDVVREITDPRADALDDLHIPRDIAVEEVGMALLHFSGTIRALGADHQVMAILLGTAMNRGWQLGLKEVPDPAGSI
jgi:hypothetical protein